MASPPALDLNNVQGDILVGLAKKTELFVFFQIDQARVKDFRSQLVHLLPLITSSAKVQDDKAQIAQNKRNAADRPHPLPPLKLGSVNIAFSQKGLALLGIKDDIGDNVFKNGMLADASNLGDPGTTQSGQFTPDWIPAFKREIDGVFVISGDSHERLQEVLQEINYIFSMNSHSASVHEVIQIRGDVRPGKEKGHEHFGFLDGISQPAVQDVDTKPNPGQDTISQGIFLVGRDGDTVTRPSWALDGSFLTFRYLFQLVPEFDTFLKKNPIPITGLSPDKGSELLGARVVGRWKSGAPIDIFPTADDPAAGADPSKNNNFRYDFADDQTTQTRCPFAAHTRKTYPRADLEDHFGADSTNVHRIIRRGIQFGPEVTTVEASSGKTQHGRGLLFVSYQSNIANGFQFIQKSWADTTTFPPLKGVDPGFDPIIGQDATDSTKRTMLGTNPDQQSKSLSLPIQWVVPRGGEYFFSPSIPALKATFAAASPANGPTNGAPKNEL